MDNKDQIIDKIRKLFRTARDVAATRGEVENALAAARRLMDKHALEENDIAEVAQADVNEAYEPSFRRSEGWLRELHCVIAYITETAAVSKKRSGGCREALFGFAGCKGDPFVALALFAEMATIARAFAKREARVCTRSYLLGFVEGLMLASVRARKQALEDSQCTALVAKKSELIKTHLEDFRLAKRRKVNVEELHQGDLSAGFRRGRDEGEKVKARGESA